MGRALLPNQPPTTQEQQRRALNEQKIQAETQKTTKEEAEKPVMMNLVKTVVPVKVKFLITCRYV